MSIILCWANLSGCDLGSVRLVLSNNVFFVETSVNAFEETDESEWYRECGWKFGDDVEVI